jgi:LCP family protein required for cell wall assembly
VGPVVRDALGVQRVTVPELGTTPAGAGGAADDGATRVLLVGRDSGLDGHEGSAQSDAVVLVTVRPAEHRVCLMSVPRDLVAADGPDGDRVRDLGRRAGELVAAVSDLVGHRVDHFVQVDAGAFPALADEIGGLRLRFGGAARDRSTGFSTSGGCDALDGERLLAYLRSRHYSEQDPSTGAWVLDDGGDLSRQQRQRHLLAAAVAQLGDVDVSDMVGLLADHAVVDRSLDLGTAVRLVRAVKSATRFDEVVLQVEDATSSQGGTVLVPTGAPPVEKQVALPEPC